MLDINDVRTTKIDQIELEKIIIAAARGDMGIEDFMAAFRGLV